jgi:uncharacterized cofD-like protein
VQGESSIPEAGHPIERVFLRPEAARAYPGAVRALLDADLIVAGPGSLFTSVLPNLLVRDIREAVAVSPAVKVYVCNVATQPGETDGFDLGQHARALERHVGPGLFDHVIANDDLESGQADFELVVPDYPDGAAYTVITRALVDGAVPWRHDAAALAETIMEFVRDK